MELKPPSDFNQYKPEKIELWQYLKDTFEIIDKNFLLKSTKKISIQNFELFNTNAKSELIESWSVNKESDNFTLCLIQYGIQFEVVTPRASKITKETHKYFFGFLNCKKDFGISYMRPETLVDKLTEFFAPEEIDFPEHKQFSAKYYVLSQEPKKLQEAINLELLEFISTIPNLQIEFRNKTCLFRLPKSIDKNETIKLCQIGLKLNQIINN